MDKKTALYICTGCGIGEALDVEKLAEVASDDFKISDCKNHPALCGPEGAGLIRQDIETSGVNTIIIAACSPRVCYDVFNFGPDKIVERVNIREQVVWSQTPQDENTQMLALGKKMGFKSKKVMGANEYELSRDFRPL